MSFLIFLAVLWIFIPATEHDAGKRNDLFYQFMLAACFLHARNATEGKNHYRTHILYFTLSCLVISFNIYPFSNNQDYVRTSTYQRAMLQNHSDFQDKVHN